MGKPHHHDHGNHDHSRLNPEERLPWATEACREAGLRSTAALRAVLAELVERDQPTALAHLCDADRLTDLCDPATVYRLLVRLEGKGIVRRIGLHERAAHYVIAYPGEHGDYLVCKQCGDVQRLDIECPVEELEQSIAKKSGFTELFHELEFYGNCPTCA